MRRTDIEILLTPSRLEVACCRSGRVRQTVVAPLDRSRWEEAWSGRLKPLDGVLKGALAELGVEAAGVRVFHRSPTAMAETFMAPGRGATALEAARLALADSAPFDLREHPAVIVPLHTWKAESGWRTLTLLAAEADESARALTAWLERQGCYVRGLVPLDATATIATVDALRHIRSAAPVVMLRLGEHGSTLSCVTDGRLDFLRPLQIDLDLLTEALTRPIQPRGEERDAVALDPWEARELLFRVGIPGQDDVVDVERDLRGHDLLPALQPALQRCMVEARQSLRFSLGEEQRTGAFFAVTGPGSLLPNLQTVLARQLSLEPLPAAERGPCVYDPFEACGPGSDLAEARRLASATLSLLPVTVRAERGRARVRNLVAAGAAAALLTGGAEAWLTWRSLDEARQELRTLQDEVGEYELERERAAEAQLQLASLRAVERDIHDLCGVEPAWDAVLDELSRLTPTNVDLITIEAANDRAEGVRLLAITGYIVEGSGSTDVADVTAFVRRLGASPLFRAATLGATQRAVLAERTAQHFEVAIELATIPEQLSDAQEGSR